MTDLEVTLITGRTLRQGQGKEYGKLSERYRKSVAVCEIDPDDLKKMNLEEGKLVKITTDNGSVLVRAVRSVRAPHSGRIFVPCGPWANVIMGSKTNGTGMPSFKGIKALVEPASSAERTLSLKELLTTHYGKK